MALAENEAITVGVLGIFGVDTHLSEEQGGHQLCGGQRAAGVAAPALAVMLMMSGAPVCKCRKVLPYSWVTSISSYFFLAYSIWTVKSMNLREKSGGSLVYLALGLHP